MKIGVIAPAPEPYVLGGAERLLAGLVAHIEHATEHEAELVTLPFPERTLAEVVDGYERFAALDVSRFDLVVSTKYPSWMIDHPRHVVYMLHTLRGLYDTYPAYYPQRVEKPDPDVAALLSVCRRIPDRASLPELFDAFRAVREGRRAKDSVLALPSPLAREVVHALDGIGLDHRAVRGYLAISRTVATRKSYFPPDAVVGHAYPPSSLEGFHCESGSYLFTASRIDRPKRLSLLLEAMRFVDDDVPLKIAGTGPDLEDMRKTSAGDPRIEWLGHVPDEDLADLYAGAIAVPFVPLDEDFGLITLEAMASGKPVITTGDSGGPTELVIDGVQGLVAVATPKAFASALQTVLDDPQRAREMGARGRERAAHVTWDLVLSAILRASDTPRVARRSRTRPKLVVTSTFPVHPPRGGGQLRCHYLYGALTHALDVEIVSLTHVNTDPAYLVVHDGLVEQVHPKSPEQELREFEIQSRVGVPITDIVAGAITKLSPAYEATLARELDDAAAVLLAHPFMYPIVRRLGPDIPVVYDAHNAEFALKDAILPDGSAGDALRDMVDAVERAATREARLVVVCSSDERELLREQYQRDDFVEVANGVDAVGTRFVTQPERRRGSRAHRAQLAAADPALAELSHLALFMASYHPPNLDAVHAIIDMAPRRPEIGFPRRRQRVRGVLAQAVAAQRHPVGCDLRRREAQPAGRGRHRDQPDAPRRGHELEGARVLRGRSADGLDGRRCPRHRGHVGPRPDGCRHRRLPDGAGADRRRHRARRPHGLARPRDRAAALRLAGARRQAARRAHRRDPRAGHLKCTS